MDNLQWLKDNAAYLKISTIERTLEMPEGTLKKFVDGRRKLTDKWIVIVEAWITDFRERKIDRKRI